MSGRLAQLGERRVRNAEVRSSILLPSTNFSNQSEFSAVEGRPPGGVAVCSSGERRSLSHEKGARDESYVRRGADNPRDTES